MINYLRTRELITKELSFCRDLTNCHAIIAVGTKMILPINIVRENGIAITKQSTNPAQVIGYQPCNQTPKFVTIKNRKVLTAANPTDEMICNFGLSFSFLSITADRPIIAKDPHVKINIDELPIIMSEIIIVIIGTINAIRQPIVIATSTLIVVTNSRFGANW